jgi:hypothetical protein
VLLKPATVALVNAPNWLVVIAATCAVFKAAMFSGDMALT